MKNNVRMFLFLFFIFCNIFLPPVSDAQTVLLKKLKVNKSQEITRLTLSLNQYPSYRIFVLHNPNRLVLDLLETRMNARNIHLPSCLITQIRKGRPDLNTLRLVLDLQTEVKFNVYHNNNYQLIIDLKEGALPVAPPPYFLKERSKLSATQIIEMPEKHPTPIPKTTFYTYEKEQAAPPQPPQPPQPVVPPHKMLVVIDPGHGGKDPGSIGIYHTKEKDIVLSIAKTLAQLINNQPNMKAVLTREKDLFLPLQKRVRLARKGNADLFIAIHADSIFDKHSNGVAIYTLSQKGATSEAARWLANKENSSELGGLDLGELGDKSSALRSVLIDLAQTATIKDSLILGKTILSELNKVVKLHSHHVEQARFAVLKAPDIPSVLVETGFLTNVNEEVRLRDKNYQATLANALFKGVQFYLTHYAPTANS